MTAIDPSSAALVRLGDVGSTNDEAMERLRDGGVPVWVLAVRQLTGRGRRGRPWVSEAGNLYASFAFISDLPTDAFGLLPLAVAVAVADAIDAATGLSTRVKWPNDVLVEGGKVCGILVETQISGPPEPMRRVVIGIGVNVGHAPEGTTSQIPVTCLSEHCPEIDAETVFSHLKPALADVIATLDAPNGIGAIRDRWLARAVGLGEHVIVRFDQDTREGRFDGLDPTGRLILVDGAGGVSLITAGDVFVRSERV
ncbi:biotin--[acetyl-CoA-carboxylase] ligase [Acuticoccus sp. M5D2P5]|uniref:biotin--[acetyl-CoA-carboxylase] ligase n=1 Tax=Acuticoccus kalidii TaxID=2910977 RepID=UPI001F3B730E|nr:biotin--[acetyl-CoA-carboxylase] ligase [Acuticoccus kalidii]MCF3935129.1 biotin--[acetyl-CoA-carboxylase] ligase [Acuticoccus kalidii]